MKIISVEFIMIGVLLITSCQKNIKVKPLPYVDQLSIECILTPGRVPQLYLSTGPAFFNPNTNLSQLFARGAFATITGPSADNLVADSVFDNLRCRWVPFYKGSSAIQIGQTYDLKVVYNGKTYTASTTLDQPKVSISSTSYIGTFHDLYGGHEGVIINFKDVAGSENTYRFQMNRNIDSSIYYTASLDKIHSTCTNGTFFRVSEFGRSIYFDKGVDGQNMQFVTEPAFTHQQDDTGYVFIQSLDKNSAEFFDNLDKQKLAQYNPFIEPVFLNSKIEGCIGVFGSVVVSDSVVFVFPE